LDVDAPCTLDTATELTVLYCGVDGGYDFYGWCVCDPPLVYNEPSLECLNVDEMLIALWGDAPV
jgi:hypothetical protein